VRDARIADNDGRQPIDEPVNPTGPYAYPSRLPVRAMLRSLQADGHPVSLSNSAGTFVCNDLFYGLMHRLSHGPARGGFIHLPILPEQRRSERERSADRDDAPRSFSAQTPALPLETQVAALEAAIACALAQSSVSQEKSS
jgi:pyroglutamyl-peptidase